MNHHIVGAMGEGTKEDEVRGDRDEDAQEDKDGPGDQCVPNVELVDAYPLEVGPEALELIVERLHTYDALLDSSGSVYYWWSLP